jgi:hypothetical protein
MSVNWKIVAVISAMIAAASCAAVERDAFKATGFWHMTADEDNGPLGEVIEFRADGTYASYDRDCSVLAAVKFHVHDQDVYVTSTIPGKGPVAVIFHPSADGSRLSFTSPRTRNNAIYERIPGNKCAW